MEVRARDWIFHKAKSIVIDHIRPGVYLFAMQAKKREIMTLAWPSTWKMLALMQDCIGPLEDKIILTSMWDEGDVTWKIWS